MATPNFARALQWAVRTTPTPATPASRLYLSEISNRTCSYHSHLVAPGATRPPSRTHIVPLPTPILFKRTFKGGGKKGKKQKEKAHRDAQATRSRRPRDDEITSPYVFLRQDDRTLSEPLSTETVLASLDRTKQFLQVTASPSEVWAGWDRENYPICSILDKTAEEAKRKEERAKQKGMKKQMSKRIELNWAIDKHDLGYKVERLRKYWEAGAKVEIVLASRAGKRKASEEEARGLVDVVTATARESACREFKTGAGEVGKTMWFYYEGPPPKVPVTEDVD